MSEMTKTATISENGTYRYLLGRRWGDGPALPWIMLNPSTADADTDDPTIRRVVTFAAAAGYSAITVANLFAFRSPSPAVLKAHGYPGGPRNDEHLMLLFRDASTPIVAAWGANRSPAVIEIAEYIRNLSRSYGVPLHCLGINRDGSPRHPLYVPSSQAFEDLTL